MSAFRLILRLARADLALVFTIFVLVATTTLIIAGTVGYSRAAATVAARQALTQAESAIMDLLLTLIHPRASQR